jgi:hypothetical protein
VVFAVVDVDVGVSVEGDAVERVELPRVCAGFTPRLKEIATGGKSVQAGVAVAVGDEDVAVPVINCDIGGMVERLSTQVAVVFVLLSQREQQLAVGGEFMDPVVLCICGVYRAVRGGCNTVGQCKHALSPGAEQLTVRAEDHHPRLATDQDGNLVVGIDSDVGDSVVYPPLGRSTPELNILVVRVSRFADQTHLCTPRRSGRLQAPVASCAREFPAGGWSTDSFSQEKSKK